MQRNDRYFLLAVILALAIMIGFPPQLSWSWSWSDIPIYKGGLPHDMALERHACPDSGNNQLWMGAMTGGLARAAWNGSSWSAWDTYSNLFGCYGVDAVEINGDEYVLGAGLGGVVYDDNSGGTFQQTTWLHPDNSNYPDLWKDCRCHDAEFYWPPTGTPNPDSLEFKYYALLEFDILNQGNVAYRAGIYRYNVSAQDYIRMDEASATDDSAHSYWRFVSDVRHRNVFYVGKQAKDASGVIYDYGGLYRLFGSYDSTRFQSVPIQTGGTLCSVYGLNQWVFEDTVYTYVVAQWKDGNTYRTSIFYSKDLSDPSPNDDPDYTPQFTYLVDCAGASTSLGSTDDWGSLETTLGINVVGKPYRNASNQIKHKLWYICDAHYGMWYDDTGDAIGAVPINGTINTGTSPTLKNWVEKCLIPDDPAHFDASDQMRLLFGTHHNGAWYLDFDSCSAGNYTWTNKTDGYTGGEFRDVRVFPASSPGTPPEVLAPAFRAGLFHCTNGSTWEALWTNLSYTAQTDPEFTKGTYCADKVGDTYYFGSTPGDLYIGPSLTSLDTIVVGGLYSFSGTGSVTNVLFDPVLNPTINSNWHQIADIAHSGTDKVYVSTGHGGPKVSRLPAPETKANVICYKEGTSAWQRIFAATSTQNEYNSLGILCLEPDPISPGTKVYAGLGNRWGFADDKNTDPDWDGKVICVYKYGSEWRSTLLWEYTPSPGIEENYNVFDITATADPQHSDSTTLFWGLSCFDAPSSANAYPQRGAVFKRYYTGSGYDTLRLYPNQNNLTLDDITWQYPPACLALQCFVFQHRVMLMASLVGDVAVGGATIYQGYAYSYDGTWHRLGGPVSMPYGDAYVGFGMNLGIDPVNGYDVYIGNRGRVFKLDNDMQTTVQSANRWEWVSFNTMDAQDSLKYLFADRDSLQQIRDQYGNRFLPHATPPVDSIYTWNWLKCYGLRSSVAETLGVFGVPIPADTTLTLLPAPNDSTWVYNYLAYIPTDIMTTNQAFLSDSITVLIVKNDDGGFWRPVDGTAGFDMVPGEGYQVGVSDTLEYQYPALTGQNSVGPGGSEHKGSSQGQIASVDPEHFQFTAYTGDFYPIYISELLVNGNSPETGDEVAVYTPENLCVGAGVYEGSFPLKIAAWKDDPSTEEVDGYTSGQTLSFKFWDASAGVEAPLEMSGITVQNLNPSSGHSYTQFGQGYYAQHVLSGSYVLPGVYSLAQNYPNPFNPTTTIRYNLPYESKVTLEVFDIMGRLVTTLAEGKQSAGFKAVQWSGTNAQGAEIASGVYFYRLKATATNPGLGQKGHFEKTHKMVLLK